MTGLLTGMFGGVLVITRLAGIVPAASQTMLSQLAHLSFGDGPAYIFIQAATAAVLLLAANTSYNDFPRVLFLMARDRQAPRKSHARIPDAWAARNCRHVGDARRGAGPSPAADRIRRIVPSPTRYPSSMSSPWIRR